MSQIDCPADTPWPPSLALHVERVCNAFEAAWQGGPRRASKSYLEDTPEPDHAVLLRELLALDLLIAAKPATNRRGRNTSAFSPRTPL